MEANIENLSYLLEKGHFDSPIPSFMKFIDSIRNKNPDVDVLNAYRQLRDKSRKGQEYDFSVGTNATSDDHAVFAVSHASLIKTLTYYLDRSKFNLAKDRELLSDIETHIGARNYLIFCLKHKFYHVAENYIKIQLKKKNYHLVDMKELEFYPEARRFLEKYRKMVKE